MDNVPHDKLLFTRIADGDEAAFRELFDSYTPRLKAFFSKLTNDHTQVQELVQDTFLNVWLYRSKLTDVETPSAYLYRIASNVSIRWFRQNDLDRQLVKAIASQQSELQEDTDLVSVKDLQTHISKAVENLPPQQQEVFRLSRESGLTRANIASKMNLSEKTVRNYMTLALESIQTYLKENYQLYIPLFLLQVLLG